MQPSGNSTRDPGRPADRGFVVLGDGSRVRFQAVEIDKLNELSFI